MLTTEKVAEITAKFGKNAKDSGSTEVQIALLTERITTLSTHFGKHIHDYTSKRGLMKMIGQRRRLLRYLNDRKPEAYAGLIKALGLRK